MVGLAHLCRRQLQAIRLTVQLVAVVQRADQVQIGRTDRVPASSWPIICSNSARSSAGDSQPRLVPASSSGP